MAVYDGVTHSRLKAISLEADVVSVSLLSATTTPFAVTAAAHNGKVIVLNKADGLVVTLPAATGSGAHFRFSVGTQVTSNTYVIKVADSTDVMSGSLYVVDQSNGTGTQFGTLAASDTITMTGLTTGGIAGGLITLIDVGPNLYAVHGTVIGTGIEATPFSATVS